MKKISVTKIACNGKLNCFSVPLPFVSLLITFLPQSALVELEERGISLIKFIDAAKRDETYCANLSVIEHGQQVTVELALD